jgi:4-hydroxybenzoate polyprenyltransferase
VSDGAGIALIVVGAVGVLVTGFWLRKVLPGPPVFALLSAFSVVLTAGALAVQEHTTAADWAVALLAMALLGPLHVRVLLGPFGRRANAVRSAPSVA